jgi:hypothetical protein
MTNSFEYRDRLQLLKECRAMIGEAQVRGLPIGLFNIEDKAPNQCAHELGHNRPPFSCEPNAF